MNKCIKCGKDFEVTKGLKNYCSLSCRNSRTWSDEQKKKVSETAKKSEKVRIANEKSRKKIDWSNINKKRKEIYEKKLLDEDFNNLSFERLRRRVIIEQNNSCNRCGLQEWFGKKLSLEIDHKDGNNSNNLRENLEGLCPNCHSITSTWRGRNKKDRRNKVTDEDLFNSLVKNNWNMRRALIELDLAAKGGNYNRCHRLKREYMDEFEKNKEE
jgi:hypothetical protein